MLPEPTPRRRPAGPTKFLRYFNLFMTLVYPAVGLYIMLSSPDQIAVQSETKKALGFILILYGIYRFFRTYQQRTKDRDAEG